MENQILIRMVMDSDVPALEKHMNNGPLDKHSRRYNRQLQGEVTYLVALCKEKPIGHVLFKWNGTKDQEVTARISNCPDLEDLFVSHEYRKKGIGQKLVHACEQLAIKRGFERVGLGVGIDNEPAKALYHKLGFQDSGIGEYKIGGTYIDENGTMRSWSETCIYLIHNVSVPDPQ